jgi:hypothetical protein
MMLRLQIISRVHKLRFPIQIEIKQRTQGSTNPTRSEDYSVS